MWKDEKQTIIPPMIKFDFLKKITYKYLLLLLEGDFLIF